MPSKKPAEASAPPEIVAAYDRMLATCPDVERKGATMPNTTWNGNMFSFLHTSGVVALRLPATERETFIEKYGTKLFDAYGVVQKEYVLVPNDLLQNTDEIAPYFAMSSEYCKSLKPKKSTSKA